MFYHPWVHLTDPEVSYLFGFAQCDGHLSKTRWWSTSQLKIELHRRDEHILLQFARIVPCKSHLRRQVRPDHWIPSRDCPTTSWYVFDPAIRSQFRDWGLPIGKKSEIVAPPVAPFSEVDYVRGLIDADGSVGITRRGLPFVSFTTASDLMASYYVDFLHRVTRRPRKTTTRNRRDGIFNILVMRELARQVADLLYYDGCIALARKERKARLIRAWEPTTPRRLTHGDAPTATCCESNPAQCGSSSS